MSLITDAATLGVAALSAVKTASDTILEKTTAAVPTLTGDAATYAEDYIENHVGGEAGNVLKMVLGLGGPVISAAEASASNIAIAGLHVATARIDADLANLSNIVSAAA